MKGKTELVIAMVSLLMVGLTSAALVPFLSNMVSGEFEVLGPVFYTAADENLIMNYEPDSPTTKTINGIEEIDFIMEENLDGVDFYKPELNFIVDLEINDFSSPRGIDLEFGYISMNGNSEKICNMQYISITEDGIIEIPCSGTIVPSNIKHFYYTIEGMGDEYLEYKIKTKNTYVEIIGVAQ